jgi:hypothetical protein
MILPFLESVRGGHIMIRPRKRVVEYVSQLKKYSMVP